MEALYNAKDVFWEVMKKALLNLLHRCSDSPCPLECLSPVFRSSLLSGRKPYLFLKVRFIQGFPRATIVSYMYLRSIDMCTVYIDLGTEHIHFPRHRLLLSVGLLQVCPRSF